MDAQRELDQLAKQIREIHASDRLHAGDRIQEFLESSLAGVSRDEKMRIVGELTSRFEANRVHSAEDVTVDREILTRVFSFILGKKVSQADLSSAELLQRLADSLNTIFDMLNQLVSVINTTFLGQREGIETIRQMIGFHLEGENQLRSLESYLGQINKAFLTAQQAFKIAAEKKVREILVELDPERIATSVGGGFKFGRLRKADRFELQVEKFKAFEKWFNSGRFMEELLREFEHNCQRLFLR
jgi:hypothetical protein